MARDTRLPGSVDPPPALGSLVNANRLGEWTWVLFYTAALTSASAFRFQDWFATGFDLGIFQQGLWGILHQGLGAYSSILGRPILADAASLVLPALAPLFALGGTGFLFVLQSFALGLGFWWLLRIGEDLGCNARVSRLVGILYLFYPALIAANLYDFHPDALAVPLLLAAYHYGLRGRWVAYAVVVAAALLVKDMVAIAVVGLGLSLVFGPGPGRRAVGAVTVVAALAWGVFAVAVFIPWLSHQTMSQWVQYYGQYGATPAAGVRYFLHDPEALAGWVKEIRSWEYLIWIGGPLAGWVVWVRRWNWGGWRFALGAFFILETNLLSRFPSQTSPFDEFSLFVIPSLFVAALAVLRRVDGVTARLRLGVVGIGALFLVVMAYHLHETTWRTAPPNVAELEAAAELIPPRAPVVAQNFVMPHLATRAKLYDTNQLGTISLARGTYVVLDERYSTGNTSPRTVQLWTRYLGKHARTVYTGDGVAVFAVMNPIENGVSP